jgi:hypothetical protein
MQEIMQFVSRHPVLSIAWIGLLALYCSPRLRTDV